LVWASDSLTARLGSVSLARFCLDRKYQNARPAAERTAIPPTTPPAIGPASDFLPDDFGDFPEAVGLGLEVF
jgi:hypothetical protein